MTLPILTGDALTLLRTLPAESVQTCVTSPPYWGLRDYGTAIWDGGNPKCDHSNIRRNHSDEKQATQQGSSRDRVSTVCRFCDARRIDNQLGLESTPEEYIGRLVEIFSEVRRVLRADGTCWLNLGDSYASNPASGGPQSLLMTGGEHKRTPKANYERPAGLKPKDLVGIPWRVAFALQADGWYLRSDIIWSKPNPMPESVTDRPTKAHEYLFLLAKQERYYYDAEAIKDPAVCVGDTRHLRTDRTVEFARPDNGSRIRTGNPQAEFRNKRSVWTLSTCPTPDAHFATFPIDLVETCILAGCPEGGTVLDPFSGAGTTGLACLKSGRRYLGIELNPAYVEISHTRARRHYSLLVEAIA